MTNIYRLHGAAESGNLPHVVHIVKQEGWDVDMREPNTCATPLMPAASNAHLPVIDWLVEHGADVNARDDALWTPLHFGAKSGACVQRLLQAGANPLLEDYEGLRPLRFARTYEDAEAIKLLEVRNWHKSSKWKGVDLTIFLGHKKADCCCGLFICS